MGRHSQTSSLSTTLTGLGSLASKRRVASGLHGRRRADGPAKTSLTPMLFKAGGAAAAFSLAVSGAAYAAISAGDDEGRSSSGGSFGLIGGESEGQAKAAATEKAGSGKIASAQTSTTTVDEPQVHGTVKKETDALPKGETQVETAGVDGLVRTTYEVTTVGGKEVSRTPVAQVVVTQKVDEVVLVGTGAAKKQESKPDQSQGQSQSQGQAQSQGQGQTQAPSESSGGSGGSASGGSAGTTGGSAGDDDVWAKLAQCESGGKPETNTGNGFYGMYQFTLETWQSLGGTGYPHEADAATQTAMAKKLQAQAGWGQWPGCADKLGLR